MKVTTDEKGLVQIIVEGISEEQVIRYALERYQWANHQGNSAHTALAFDMYNQVVTEFIKDTELTEEEKATI